MSSETSAAKWLVGCLVAAFFAVLLCAGGVALIVFWGYSRAQQVARQMGPEIQNQIEQAQFGAEWRPPADDAGPDELFPESIGAWVRAGQDDAAAIPELAIETDGQHGTYESTGTKVDVYAYRVPHAEKGAIFDAAVSAIDTTGYTHRNRSFTDLGSAHWMTFSFSPPARRGRLWWAKDWLIVTMTENADLDLERFERDYLLSIQGPPQDSAPPGVTPAEPQVPDRSLETAPSDQLADPSLQPAPVDAEPDATEPATDDPSATDPAPDDPAATDPAPDDPAA
jgi:hypothetical protein